MCFPLLDLPLPILEDIVALSLHTLLSNTLDKVSEIIVPYVKQARLPDPLTFWGLLLSLHLSAVAARVIYSRACFGFGNTDVLAKFLERVGTVNLARLRYIILLVDWGERQPLEPHPYRALDDIQKWADLIGRLPESLQYLELWPLCRHKTTLEMTSRTLRVAIQRLRNLRALSLCNPFGPVPYDLIVPAHVAPTPSAQAHEYGMLGHSATSNFPYLRGLLISGVLESRLGHCTLAEAFSPRYLPALRSMSVLGFKVDSSARGQKSALNSVLKNISPLTKFFWFDHGDIETWEVNSHFHMVDAHIVTLREHHGHRIQELILDFKCHFSEAIDVSGECIANLVSSLPNLRHAAISTPFVDFCTFMEALMVSGTGSDMLPSNLQTLNILFGARESQLYEALAPRSSKVRQVLLSPSIARLLTFHLRIVISGTEYDPSLEIADEKQNPWELDPRPFLSLELLLTAFIEEGVRASGGQKASDWYKLAVIRVEQYDPNWIDEFCDRTCTRYGYVLLNQRIWQGAC